MITALFVSVNYSDYLEVALPYNTLQFDQIIVLTIESDKACQDLCSKYSNVKCLVFPDEILKKNGTRFNKGAIINKGFQYLNETGYQDWLVMTDSDIVFPESFKELLLSKEKDPKVLYGMNRRYCNKRSEFIQYLHSGDVNYLGDAGCKIPFMGFCQIFIYKVDKFNYVEKYDAEMCDILFLTNFSEKFKKHIGAPGPKMFKKTLLNDPVFINLSPEDFVIHLGRSKENWKGRNTEPFV